MKFEKTLYSGEFINKIIEDYESGIFVDSLIKDYHISFYTLKAFLKSAKIRIRTIRDGKIGKNNPMWKEGKINIYALHQWVRRNKSKSNFCENCKENKNKFKFLDLANISGEYKRDVNDYKWLCRSCHMREDNRILNLKQYQNG